jgi:hypothetical protein
MMCVLHAFHKQKTTQHEFQQVVLSPSSVKAIAQKIFMQPHHYSANGQSEFHYSLSFAQILDMLFPPRDGIAHLGHEVLALIRADDAAEAPRYMVQQPLDNGQLQTDGSEA